MGARSAPAAAVGRVGLVRRNGRRRGAAPGAVLRAVSAAVGAAAGRIGWAGIVLQSSELQRTGLGTLPGLSYRAWRWEDRAFPSHQRLLTDAAHREIVTWMFSAAGSWSPQS